MYYFGPKVESLELRAHINYNPNSKLITYWKIDHIISNCVGWSKCYDKDLIDPHKIIVCDNTIQIIDGSHNIQSANILCMDNEKKMSFPYDFLCKQLINKYKGYAIVENKLYLANYIDACIDVYDNTYNKLDYEFRNKYISDNHAPNNIVYLDGHLFVLWSDKNKIVINREADYISKHKLDGSFVERFTSGGELNLPCTMIPAPAEHGIPQGSFIIGNNGDGRMHIYDRDGLYIGPLFYMSKQPIAIDGLWRLVPQYNINKILYIATKNNYNSIGSLKLTHKIYLDGMIMK
jgi:hypothetical protein